MDMDGIGRKLGVVASLAVAALLAGCVAYPVGGEYYAAPYYAPPVYAVAPAPAIGFWGGYGGGYGHGHGRHWR